MQIKGNIEGTEGVSFEKKGAYFLMPEPDLEKLDFQLQAGDRIRLWLNDKNRCFKVEKIV